MKNKPILTFLLSGFLLFLISCGDGGGGSNEPFNAVPDETPVEGLLRIWILDLNVSTVSCTGKGAEALELEAESGDYDQTTIQVTETDCIGEQNISGSPDTFCKASLDRATVVYDDDEIGENCHFTRSGTLDLKYNAAEDNLTGTFKDLIAFSGSCLIEEAESRELDFTCNILGTVLGTDLCLIYPEECN